MLMLCAYHHMWVTGVNALYHHIWVACVNALYHHIWVTGQQMLIFVSPITIYG